MSDSTSFCPPEFGTDGIRGRAGEPPLDTETLHRLGAALGIWLQGHGTEPIRTVLGHDGRQSAAWIEDALAAGLASSDVKCVTLGLTTTPALAYVTRTQPFTAGVMISASHNPAHDNGVKIFAGDGTKLADAVETEVADLTRRIEFDQRPDGRAQPRRELLEGYEAHVAQAFSELDLTGTRLVIDAANGGGSELAPRILRAFGADVVEVHCNPDGTNINDGCGALYPDRLSEVVTSERAVLGISLDGDGDRGIFIDDQGVVRDGDAILAALGRDRKRCGTLPHDTVVATVMSNLGLRKVLDEAGIRMQVTPVGDRAVVQAMRDGGFGLGGEQSGHILIDGEGALTGDGLFTALALLSLPAMRDGRSHAAFAGFERFPQRLINIPVHSKPPLDTLTEVQAKVADVERTLGDQGRVLLRYSGTENLCRVMVEAPTQTDVDHHAESIAEQVRTALGT